MVLSSIPKTLHNWLNITKPVDFLAPLLLRLYLVPVFWMAGNSKLSHFSDTVQWFGDKEYGLGLPFPFIMALLATSAEVIGAIFLALGIAVRWICIPLMITMIVAMVTVHLPYGWQAIASPNAPFANERVLESKQKLAAAKRILKQHGNYKYLTSSGSIVILNNGIEFAATYFIMLLTLFFIGAGRYLSIDYWFQRYLMKPV